MPVGTHVIEAIAVDPIPRYIESDIGRQNNPGDPCRLRLERRLQVRGEILVRKQCLPLAEE